MRFFYDLEFLEGGRTIDPISIGIVSEAGDEYYAVNAAVNDSSKGNDLGSRIASHVWLMENVVPHLPLRTKGGRYSGPSSRFMPPNLNMADIHVKPLWCIANEVREFLHPSDDSPAELWAYYGAYDHVALMQLWGPAVRKPAHVPWWTRDVRQYAEHLGVDESALPVQVTDAHHHALHDARWCHAAWRSLDARQRTAGFGSVE